MKPTNSINAINPFELRIKWYPYVINLYNYEADKLLPHIRLVHLPEKNFHILKDGKTMFYGREHDAIVRKVDELEDINIDFPFIPCLSYTLKTRYVPLLKVEDKDVKHEMLNRWKKLQLLYPENIMTL
jgi:hypothetical protein